MHLFIEVEILQLLILLVYIIPAWRQETWWSRLGICWWCAILGIDIFLWKGQRPCWLRDFLNTFDISIGMLLIYAKTHRLLRKYFVAIVAFFLSLL